MSDEHVHPLHPDEAEDRELAARIAAAYSAFPNASELQVEMCRERVLASAPDRFQRVFTDAFTVRRRRWWWGGAAAAALLVVATLRPVRLGDSSVDDVDSSTLATAVEPAGRVTVVDGGKSIRFDLRLPAGVRQVTIVGDFNGWDTTANAMSRQAADGSWSTKIPLPPGMHTYAFIIDGQRWMVDPLAPQVPDQGFGAANALIVEPH